MSADDPKQTLKGNASVSEMSFIYTHALHVGRSIVSQAMPRKAIFQIVLLTILLATIIGCAGQRIASYDYHKPSAFTGVGRFNLTFNPDLRFRDTDQGRIWEVAGPYHFNTQYIHLDGGAVRGRVCDIHVESVDSEFRFDFDGCDQDIWSDRGDVSANNPKMLLGFGIPDIEMPYEDMRVRFNFEIEGIDGKPLDSGTVDEIVTRNKGTVVLR